MSKWIDFSIDERKAMVQAVSESKQIDEASAEKDWWLPLFSMPCSIPALANTFCSKAAQALAKGGTS